MKLNLLDLSIIGLYVLAALFVGVLFRRKASGSVNHFFLSNRTLPWWLIGVSMAATNFSIDTPLAICKYVFEHGISGVWFFWSMALSALLATFFFSRLWRRAEVMTDVELIELRYSGRAASGLRLFKGFYFGVLVNCFVMGWVFRALIKVVTGLTTWEPVPIIALFTLFVLIYTLLSGFYGVVVTDFIQYGVCMGGSVLLAAYSVAEAGGIGALVRRIDDVYGREAGILNFFPDLGGQEAWMPVSVFLVYIMVQWWAHKYSDGGGKHIQRMCAARDEKHARLGTLLFAFLNYSLQIWPWILTALAAMVVLGPLDDPEMGYPLMMARVLPHGILGLLVVSLLGAFMSTIDTHLNLGAAYLINDIYRRFLVKNAPEKHYLVMSRLAILGILAVAIFLAFQIRSVGDAWKFILAFAGGAGPVWVLRWFWWRINVWSEIAAMTASGIVAIYLQVRYPEMLYSWRLLLVIGLSASVWVPATLLTPVTDPGKLERFVRKVGPGSLGWRPVYRKHGIAHSRYLYTAALDWTLGVAALFSLTFSVGSLCLGKTETAMFLVPAAAVSGTVLLFRILRKRPP